jgi:hypothetical protein
MSPNENVLGLVGIIAMESWSFVWNVARGKPFGFAWNHRRPSALWQSILTWSGPYLRFGVRF